MQAIYARQSVDKKDSISIDFQIEECERELKKGDDYKVFFDKGFSGKSTNRPQFQAMMNELKEGNISRIVIYRLDRISRSIRDFSAMLEDFIEYDVELTSCAEKIDIKGPMGHCIACVLMTFAEMERKTIQQRVIDNYYARGEKGFYLGGYAPFGYRKIETKLEGKKTYAYEENTEESPIVQQIYADYIDGKSLGAIARYLNDCNVPTRKNKPWSPTCISRMLKNPVYVKSNADIYNYLSSRGATINNPVDEFDGELGCYVYGNEEKRTGSKFVNLTTDYVTLGQHKGIIEPSDWLDAQYIFNSKKGHSNLGTGSLSWLQGLVKCSCGYSYYVKKSKGKNKEYKHLYCRGRKNNSCPYPRIMRPVEEIESFVEGVILEQIASLKGEEQGDIIKDTPQINKLKIKISEIDQKIQNLIDQLANGSTVVSKYINSNIEILDKEKAMLYDEITQLELKANKNYKIRTKVDSVLTDWYSYDIETKKKIAKELISKVILEGNEITIISN